MTNKLTPIPLPTEDASILYIDKNDKLWYGGLPTKSNPNLGYMNQHLYLVSDEPIKEGDCYIFRGQVIGKATAILISNIKLNDLYDQYQKIIFTTDPKLIADGVLPIDGNTKAYTSKEKLKQGDVYYSTGSVMGIGIWNDQAKQTDNDFKEVNFLTEFCKRYNQKDNEEVVIENVNTGRKITNPDKLYFTATTNSTLDGTWRIIGNQKVDVEKFINVKELLKYIESNEDRDFNLINAPRMVEWLTHPDNQALQSTGGYSLEDAIKFGVNIEAGNIRRDYSITASQQFLQSLQPQPKGDMVIEVEMEEYVRPTKYEWERYGEEPKIKLDSNGQPTLIFK